MAEVLHEDDPEASAVLADGTVVRNMTAEEYAERFSDPGLTLHELPPDVQAAIDAMPDGE